MLAAAGFLAQKDGRYEDFIRRHKELKVVFFELGTGMNTPDIIKYNFWKMTSQWENATYAYINLSDASAPDDIKKKSICIGEDIGKVLEQLSLIFSRCEELPC